MRHAQNAHGCRKLPSNYKPKKPVSEGSARTRKREDERGKVKPVSHKSLGAQHLATLLRS